MKRDPSLHITKSNFLEIITDLMPKGVDCNGLTNIIFFRAKAYSIHTRTITVSNDRIEKKAKKMVMSSRRDADLLAQLIYATRKRMKHRGIISIKPGSKDWDMTKEVTAHALNFTNEFNLTRRYGFIRYIEVGISKMKKFSLNKFPSMYEGICETYQAMLEIEKDQDSNMTKLMYKIYARKFIENTGIYSAIEELPEKYVWFVRAREQAKELNVSVNIYMISQFEALDFTKDVIHPALLVGPKATERVIRYCFNHGIKVGK